MLPDGSSRDSWQAFAANIAMFIRGERTAARVWNRQQLNRGDLALDLFRHSDGILAVLHDYGGIAAQYLSECGAALQDAGVTHSLVWSRGRDARRTTSAGARQLFGVTPEQLTVQVDGLPLLLRPWATPSGGVFLDTTLVRQELIRSSAGARVLNLFCFTGSLGLAAAVGGAHEVVQVDISKSILRWARENANLQPLSDKGCLIRYLADDAVEVLHRFKRRIERHSEPGFDTIIVDPPPFGTTGRNRFDLSKLIPTLIHESLACLSSGGRLFFMCNETGIGADMLANSLPDALRSSATVRSLAPPPDQFPGDPARVPMMRGILVTRSAP